MRLEWDDENASRLLVDDRGGLHIAFVADDASGPGVLYLRSDGASSGSWRATKAVHPAGIYFDLALDPDRRVAIAFVQAGGVSQPRANVLFLTQSSDSGTSWSRPEEISTPDEDPAIEPHVFFDRDQALRVVWVQQSLGAFTGGRVWQATLGDTGRRAATALALPSDVMTSHSQAAIDGCGTIHFMTQWYPHGDSELRYARLTSGSWSGWSRPFDTHGGHASLIADRAAVHVVWNSSSRSPVDGTYRSGLVHGTLPVSRLDSTRQPIHHEAGVRGARGSARRTESTRRSPW
jgi:hypothetical protein